MKSTYLNWREASRSAIALGIKTEGDYSKECLRDPKLPEDPSAYPGFPGWEKFLTPEAGNSKTGFSFAEFLKKNSHWVILSILGIVIALAVVVYIAYFDVKTDIGLVDNKVDMTTGLITEVSGSLNSTIKKTQTLADDFYSFRKTSLDNDSILNEKVGAVRKSVDTTRREVKVIKVLSFSTSKSQKELSKKFNLQSRIFDSVYHRVDTARLSVDKKFNDWKNSKTKLIADTVKATANKPKKAAKSSSWWFDQKK
jgi:hypothetical protein